jgi:long-chain acyl-CoA synthetase
LNLAFDLERRAAEAGDRLALSFDDGREFSFADLDGWASRLGGALKELGVSDGDRVALYLKNGPELVCSLFALWKIAAVPITISSLYGANELAASMSKASAVAVISDPTGLANMQLAAESMTQAVIGGVDLPSGVANLDQLAANCSAELRAPDLPGDRDAVVLFTGGTTGDPKAVAMTHGGTFETMSRLARAAKGGKKGPYPLVSEETSPNLIGLPLFHSGGQQTLLFALHVGRSILLMEKFSAERTAELVARYRIDNLFLLPTMLYDIAHLAGEPDFSSVRSVLVAGGEVSSALRALFEERFRIPLLNNYGSTETGHVAGWTASDIKAGAWLPGSVGRVYDGVELEIRDDQGVAVARGEAGEICVRTTVSSGYVDGSAEVLVDESGWIASGDVGYLNDDDVLFLVGRKREMIKCGGFQVWPTELEEELRQHPAVDDVAVVGAADERMGEIPMAFVVANEEISPGDLIEFARERQAHYKAIRAVEFIDELPRTAAGKIDRQALRSMAADA